MTVIRGGRTVATSTAISPVEDPATPGLGAVEVNHPGGGCWSNVTPNLLPGDIVRYTNAAGLAEQTRTRYVTAYRAVMVKTADTGLANGIVEAHGRALNFDARATRIKDDADATALWSREYRRGWEPKV